MAIDVLIVKFPFYPRLTLFEDRTRRIGFNRPVSVASTERNFLLASSNILAKDERQPDHKRIMKKNRFLTSALVVIAAVIIGALVSCGKLDKAVDESQAWRAEFDRINAQMQKQIDETRRVAKETADAAVKAVPGERYSQLIDAVNGTDPGKKLEAQNFLKSLANIRVDEDYEVSVWFGVNSKVALSADIFRAESPLKIEVENYVNNELLNLSPVSTSTMMKQTESESKAVAFSKVDSVLEALQGSPAITASRTDFTFDFPASRIVTGLAWTPNGILLPLIPVQETTVPQQSNPDGRVADFNAQANAKIQAATEERHRLAHMLTDAIYEPYAGIPLPSGPQRLHLPWPPLDGKQFLFIILPEKQWVSLPKDGAEIVALVHKRGDSTQAYQDMRKYTFSLDEFNPQRHQPATHPISGSLVWAVHNMTTNEAISEATFARLNTLRDTLRKWEAEAQPQTAK